MDYDQHMMKDIESIIHIPEELVSKLAKLSARLTYPVDAEIIYEGHTPIVAILLTKGRIKLVRGRRVRKILERGSLLGVPELMNNSPFEYTAQINRGSEIIYLDRSTIKEILEGTDPELAEIFVELLEQTA
jgi:CRP-like cAMP-binding protein